MSYSDIFNVINQYGSGMKNLYANRANNLNSVKFNRGPVNPNSSAAFTPKTARDIYSSSTAVNNPMTAFNEYKPYSGENLMMQGMQGAQYGTMASKASPFLQDFATSLGAKGTMTKGGLGPAAAVYGLTQNQNPYDFTKTEKLGTIASTALAARSIAPMIGSAIPALATPAAGLGAAVGMHPALLIGSLLLGNMFAKKKDKKAKGNVEKVRTEVKGEQDDIYDTRADEVEEMREDMLSQYTTDMYNQRQGRYSNQYGGNYSMEEGGKMDIVAEFTGNELIVNDQDKVEKGLASENYAMAAAPIKQAMKNKQLTPGPETHQGNPMPVDAKGNIYAGGGALPFKANKGAGIYDHATDQFKPTMTDKEIAMVAQENINKWESNGMA